MENFEIKKGIEITRNAGRKKYPFEKMEIGECFDLPICVDTPKNIQQSVSICARSRGFKVVTSKYDDENFIRVWRVK